ncbi:hypothetical protein COLO4_02066, partial [Corchorus olitorius]
LELAQLLRREGGAVHQRARLGWCGDQPLHLVDEDARLRLGIHPQDRGGVQLHEPRRLHERRQGVLATRDSGAELRDEELQVPLSDVRVGDGRALRRHVDHVAGHAEESGRLAVADFLLLEEAHVRCRRAAGLELPVVAGDEHVATLDGHLESRLDGVRLGRGERLVYVPEMPVRNHPVIGEPLRSELGSRRPQAERPRRVCDGGEADGEARDDVLPLVPDIPALVLLALDGVADDALFDVYGHVLVRDEVDAARLTGTVDLRDEAVAVARPVEVDLRRVHPLAHAHLVTGWGDEDRRLRHLDLQPTDLAIRVDRERRHQTRAQVDRRPHSRLTQGRRGVHRLALEPRGARRQQLTRRRTLRPAEEQAHRPPPRRPMRTAIAAMPRPATMNAAGT